MPSSDPVRILYTIKTDENDKNRIENKFLFPLKFSIYYNIGSKIIIDTPTIF